MLHMHGIAGDLMRILFVSQTLRQRLEDAEHY